MINAIKEINHLTALLTNTQTSIYNNKINVYTSTGQLTTTHPKVVSQNG